MKTLPLLHRGMLLLVLLAGGLGGVSMVNAQSQPTPTATIQWRRTVDGWERADLWELQPRERQAAAGSGIASTGPSPLPVLHPVLVASLMLAAAGLLAIGPTRRNGGF